MNMEYLIKESKYMIRNDEIIHFKKNDKNFNILINLYKQGLNLVVERLNEVKDYLNELYGYEVINNITSRIKSSTSIEKKMSKKDCPTTYKNLINNINDVAGARIICNHKDDIYKIKKYISQIDEIKILREKDYIKYPKKSGYSAYHMIIEVPIEINNQFIYIKVEIQIRTKLMDFWASIEHTVKYKTDKKLSTKDSAILTAYAKIINKIGDNMTKIYRKQNEEKCFNIIDASEKYKNMI